MIYLRSLLYRALFFPVSISFFVAACLGFLIGKHWFWLMGRYWALSVNWLLDKIVNVKCRFDGLENVPEGGCLIASKHQSMWETVMFLLVLKHPSLVMKQELLKIPVYGKVGLHLGMIAVDRSGHAKALKTLMSQSKAVVAEGRPVVIFPEGTRKRPGDPPAYQIGIAALYRNLNVPVIPVALNSGVHWSNKKFIMPPGTIVMSFLPAIAPGLQRDDFMLQLQQNIESECERIRKY